MYQGAPLVCQASVFAWLPPNYPSSPPRPSRVPLTWWPFFAAGFRCPFSVPYWFLDSDSWCKSWNLLRKIERLEPEHWLMVWLEDDVPLICVWFLGFMLHFEGCMSFDLMHPLTLSKICWTYPRVSIDIIDDPDWKKMPRSTKVIHTKKRSSTEAPFYWPLAQPYWVGFLKPKMEY